jgi:uncharacterized protein (TIGR00304 family)
MDLISIGMIVIVVGFLIVIIGMLLQSFSGQKTDTKFSFVGFIGPFPFGFGNDKQWVMTTLVIAIVLFFLVLWLFKGVR